MEPYGYRYIKTSNPYLYCRTEIFSGSSLNLGRVRSKRKKIDGPKKMGEMNASLPNKESAFLPRILEVERTKVIPQTALPVPNHGHQAEVGQLLIFIERPVLALQNDGHVELFNNQVYHLSRRCRRGHLDANAGALGQPGFVGRIHLEDVGLGGTAATTAR